MWLTRDGRSLLGECRGRRNLGGRRWGGARGLLVHLLPRPQRRKRVGLRATLVAVLLLLLLGHRARSFRALPANTATSRLRSVESCEALVALELQGVRALDGAARVLDPERTHELQCFRQGRVAPRHDLRLGLVEGARSGRAAVARPAFVARTLRGGGSGLSSGRCASGSCSMPPPTPTSTRLARESVAPTSSPWPRPS